METEIRAGCGGHGGFCTCPACTVRRSNLKELTERVYRKVCSVHGVVTKEEADEKERLQGLLGMKWDPACQKWRTLDEI